jgi:hypothetical protein
MLTVFKLIEERIMSHATLHNELIEQTLIALNQPTFDAKLRLYHLIDLWLELHPNADVYERFKARTALALLKDSLGEGLVTIEQSIRNAA